MEEHLEEIKKILKTPIALRSTKMIDLLISLTKEISFFRSLISELGPKMHYRICEFLNLEYREAESVLFHEGDKGENFYILLNGKVKLLISKRGSDEKTLTEIAQLSSGQSFGELSLIKNQPRTATVICMQSCYFMTLSKENYLRLLGKSFAKMLEEKIEFLHSLPIFSRWSKKSLEKLSYFFIPKTFKQNQVIYFNEQVSECTFVIVKGEVELTTTNRTDRALPKQLKVALIGEKDFFGDEEVLLGVPRKYTARCVSKVLNTYCINKEDFLTKVDKDSLLTLRRTNNLRNDLRELRLKGVKTEKSVENKSVSPESKLRIANSFTQVCARKVVSKSPVRNLCISPMVMQNIKKKSLVDLNSPTASIIHSCLVTTRPKSVNVFVNVCGFQPNNRLPFGIFRRIQSRIKRNVG